MKRYSGVLCPLAVAALLALAPIKAWAAAPPATEITHAEAEVRRLQAELAEKLRAAETARAHLAAATARLSAARAPKIAPLSPEESLWRDAVSDLHGKRYDKAVAKFERFLRTCKREDRQGEGWYLLAEAYRGQGKQQEALGAFRECQRHATRFGSRARYELAVALLAAGSVDEAEKALTRNLALLRFEPDAEAQEKTLFALGGLLYQRRNYREAVRHFEKALGHFRDNSKWVRARFQLADCYRQIAAQANQDLLLGPHAPEFRDWSLREYRQWLGKAATEFSGLAKFLDSPKGKEPFTVEQLTAEQRSQLPFIAAKCWFNLGDYAKALDIYDNLAVRNPGKLEGLEAMGGSVSCHAALGDRNRVRDRLRDINRVLPRHEESVRRPWSEWVQAASKGLGGL